MNEVVRPSNEDLLAELEAAAAKWVLEKNKYTLESLRDARAAALRRMTPPETSEGTTDKLQRIYAAWRNGTASYARQDVGLLLEEIIRLRPARKASE